MMPACKLAWAAASPRRTRCLGSPDRTTERCRNAAAAARPPRACARLADCSSAAATSSLGPAAAVARCHARRSGSTLGSVASARARWTSRRCSLVAVRYTAERTSGWRKVTRGLRARSPSVSASIAETAMPSCSEARSRSSGSPMGSAAASSNRRRASSETALTRRTKLSWIRPDIACASGSPKPPASCVAVNPRGNSSNANGFPRVSAMIRSRTRSSSLNRSVERSSARASPLRKPRTSSPSTCWSSKPGSRAANTNPTRSASRRRATKASVNAEARSSHCASSTTHSSGRCSASAANKLSTANPTRNRSGAVPSLSPNTVSSARRCGAGSSSMRSSNGAHN